ncbi:hypothetical protein BDY19DRAFT_890744 [Irpex rosettiformis]|uniref:Uncharacterized protein n=1 Tax=Irpex rosettiformis TaxID=378272 RepID=A0ACB8U3I0_9APHY|nr:hypothetical protein BDY19DRAFT_890744 [Irpex rosettiformis]
MPRSSQSSRRGLRGRGFPSRGGYNNDWRVYRQEQAPPVYILDGLVEEAVQSISDPSTANVGDIEAKDVQYLASYTWTDAKQPTMIVPGSPRVWRNRPLPYTVPPDTGVTYAYSNSVKIPSSPLLPLFRAIDHIESSESSSTKLDWSSVDFITDRNNLRKLLSWIEHKEKGGRIDEFRIDLQLCGVGTVLMQRWEPHAVYDARNSGYGDSFEKESTSPGPDCEKGIITGHSRIISYVIHGMKIVVRCEVDACIDLEKDEDSQSLSIETRGSNNTSPPKAVSADDLADALSSLSVTSSSTPQDVKIVDGGAVVPQSSLVKIKTRSMRNVETFDWSAAYLQLFLGQTYNLYLGVHQRGTFNEVREVNLETPEFQEAAKDMQPVLKKLGRLLDEILYIAIEYGHKGRLSVVCRAGQLKVYERKDEASFLPKDVLARFE